MKRHAKLLCSLWVGATRALSTTHGGLRRPVAVVSGIGGGIGGEFAKQLAQKNFRVIGLARKEGIHDHEVITGIDFEDSSTIKKLPAEIERLLGPPSSSCKIDLRINCSAVLGSGSPGPERSVKGIDPDWMEKSFKVNTFGHVHVTSSLLPWIAAGNAPASPARIVNMSARVGSIEDNSLGGWYSYRMSKAALNQFTKTLAIELKRTNTVVLSLHPGTTDTTLSKPFQKNVKEGKLFTPEHAVSMMLEVVLTRGMAHTGGFVDYAGLPIAW